MEPNNMAMLATVLYTGSRRGKTPRGKARPVWLCILAFAGCGPQTTRFNVVDYPTDGPPSHYFEDFRECYYSTDASGRFDVVARRIGVPERGGVGKITQVVHLRGIWHPDPGRTYAEQTMINATVSYMIVDGSGGASFEGGGFVSFREDYARTTAFGKLELAKLAPVRSLGEGKRIFERAEVRGEFTATRDRLHLTRILTEMRHLFGPLPRYQPRGKPDVL
jgi:hypothetical protein